MLPVRVYLGAAGGARANCRAGMPGPLESLRAVFVRAVPSYDTSSALPLRQIPHR